jgi:hypothetical protein
MPNSPGRKLKCALTSTAVRMIEHWLKHSPVLACRQPCGALEKAAKEGGIFISDIRRYLIHRD